MTRDTPIKDLDRLAEAINNAYGNQINTRQDFNRFYDKFMDNQLQGLRDTRLRRGVFIRLKRTKVISMARERMARPTVVRRKVPTRDFQVVGKIKTKVVQTRREVVFVRGQGVIRHRDKLGRFASIKRKT